MHYHYSDTLDNSFGLRVDYTAIESTWQWRQYNHGMLDRRAGLVRNRTAMQLMCDCGNHDLPLISEYTPQKPSRRCQYFRS